MRKVRTVKMRETAIAILILAMLGSVDVASAGPPTEALKTSIDEVLRVLEEPGLNKPEKKHERRQVPVDVISKRFNLEERAKRTVGAESAKRTPEERREFAAPVPNLLANPYL